MGIICVIQKIIFRKRVYGNPLARCGKFIFCITLLLVANVYATTAAAFLDNGVSARSEGMARAFTALANDLDAFYYNPAGYGLQSKTRVNTMFAKNRNIENVQYLGYGQKLFGGYGAVNFYSSFIDDIPLTTLDKDGRPVDQNDSFTAGDRALIFSYGRSLGNILGSTELGRSELSWGVNVKYIQQDLYENHSSGAGLDAGLYYRTGQLNAGVSIINLLEPQLTWDTDNGTVETVTRQQRFGIAYQVLSSLLVSGELTARENQVLTGIGVEFSPLELFSLRAGTFTEHYTLGLGMILSGLTLDYAYVVPADYLIEQTHKISVGYIF